MTTAELITADAAEIASAELNWDKLSGKTVLISGATGYVPQYLVHGIMKRNDEYESKITVLALCRNAEKASMRFSEYFGRSDFKLLVQDMFSEINYPGEIHYIIHAASPAGVKNSNKDPLETFMVNVDGCRLLLELAREKNAEFLLFSSVDVYGKNSTGERFTETYSGALDSLDPRNVYACAKRACETLCMCYSQAGVVTKIIRPTQIMAGGIPLDDGRLHIDFISQILSDHKITLKGDGSPRRSFIYVTDAISGILTVLADGKSGNAYNICNEEAEASVLELAETMAACSVEDVSISFNMQTRTSDPAVTHAVSVVTASSEKLRATGWEPHVGLYDACRRMMSYYDIKTK